MSEPPLGAKTGRTRLQQLSWSLDYFIRAGK
jgi:hypothetical protein